MKKLMFALAAMLLCGTVAIQARDTYSHDKNVLPAAAQSILRQNFKAGVSVIKIDKELGHISEYEVILTDGTEVQFDNKGNWQSVETAVNRSVPKYFVLTPISKYIAANHAGTRITGIDKNRHGYEVELSNGIELKFDREGNFRRYDD